MPSPHSSIDPRYCAQLPDSLTPRIPRPVIATLLSDLTEEGTFGARYLVITAEELLILEEGNDERRIALDTVETAPTDALFGAGRLLVEHKDGAQETVLTHSRDLVPEFAAAARIIDQLAKGEATAETIIYPDLEPASRSATGIPLSERGATSPLDVPRLDILRRLSGFLAPYRGKCIALMVLITLSSIAQIAIPMIGKYLVDNILRQGEYQKIDATAAGDQLNLLVAYIAVAFVIILITRLIANNFKAWIAVRLVADLRAKLHKKLARLKMAYHDRHESGQVVGRVMNDTNELQHFMIDGLPFFLTNIIITIVVGVILVSYHPFLALCVFLPVPFLVGGGSWFWKRLVPLFHKTGNRRGTLHSSLSQSIAGVKVIKALGQEDARQSAFEKTNESLFSVNYQVNRTFIRFFEIMAFATGLGTVAVWYFGGHAILDPDSEFTVGTLMAFMGLMAMFYAPLQWFTAVMNWTSNAFASAERIFQVLDQEPEVYSKKDAIPLPTTKGALQLDNVRFSYNRGKEIIKGISLDVEPGQMIGLVGKSGAGKSTIIQLLCRFYDVDSGRITIDGHDLRDVSLTDWRSHIGIVMQDPYLFSASIAENIATGKPDATFEEIMDAARAAHAHHFILDKEEGYDTIVGDGGTDLSGGEKQRLSIARAILGNPKILILDEATSAVDAETEKAIQEAISTLVQGRTTIAIAHRLPTLRHADKLVVVEDGTIIEEGTHEELLAKKDGHFAHLVALQTENNALRTYQH